MSAACCSPWDPHLMRADTIPNESPPCPDVFFVTFVVRVFVSPRLESELHAGLHDALITCCRRNPSEIPRRKTRDRIPSVEVVKQVESLHTDFQIARRTKRQEPREC